MPRWSMTWQRVLVSSGIAVLAALVLAALSGVALDASPARPAASFIFTAAGDYGSTSNTDGVLDGIAASGAQFNLALGDLSYANPNTFPETSWCSYVRARVGDSFPFELIAGNHDA